MFMAGSEDKLMSVRLMEDMAWDYRRGVQTLVEEKRHDAVAVQSRVGVPWSQPRVWRRIVRQA